MFKVLLVDDEPFILQGLEMLIDWSKEGFEIVATASNGLEAINILENQKVDLIITDVNMPVLSGFDLLEEIREKKLSNAHFVILSGHADFVYAQNAIRNNCVDYILKPIERESLIKVLTKITKMNDNLENSLHTDGKMERAYLARNLISVVTGKFDNLNLEYIKNHLKLSEGVRYIEIELDSMKLNDKCKDDDKITDEEKRSFQRILFSACLEFLKTKQNHCVFDVSRHENIYDIGLVYCDFMAEEHNESEEEYIENFYDYLCQVTNLPITIIVGKKVKDISQISKSYGTASMLRSFQGFRERKNIYYYENEAQVKGGGILLCKKSIDELLREIEHNNHSNIIKSVDRFFDEMQQMGVVGECMTLNINYLLFQLIHLASIQDKYVNQEEIFRMISESSFDEGIIRGSKAHLRNFACKYGDYMTQLRNNVSRGVLLNIENEIQENYATNLTLKSLSEKYYVNSAYLGQLFRKKYGCSFKDYLNQYRLEQAATLLVRTDKKIYQIAEDVGYHDQDYFINRFILLKGCTPARYRKQTCSCNYDIYSLT